MRILDRMSTKSQLVLVALIMAIIGISAVCAGNVANAWDDRKVGIGVDSTVVSCYQDPSWRCPIYPIHN